MNRHQTRIQSISEPFANDLSPSAFRFVCACGYVGQLQLTVSVTQLVANIHRADAQMADAIRSAR